MRCKKYQRQLREPIALKEVLTDVTEEAKKVVTEVKTGAERQQEAVQEFLGEWNRDHEKEKALASVEKQKAMLQEQNAKLQFQLDMGIIRRG